VPLERCFVTAYRWDIEVQRSFRVLLIPEFFPGGQRERLTVNIANLQKMAVAERREAEPTT